MSLVEDIGRSQDLITLTTPDVSVDNLFPRFVVPVLRCPFCLGNFSSRNTFGHHLRGPLHFDGDKPSGKSRPHCAELRKLYPQGQLAYSEYQQVCADACKANNVKFTERRQLSHETDLLERCSFCSKEMNLFSFPRHFRGNLIINVNVYEKLTMPNCVGLRRLYPQGLTLPQHKQLMTDLYNKISERASNNNNEVDNFTDSSRFNIEQKKKESTLMNERPARSGIKCPYCLHVLKNKDSLKQHIRGITGRYGISRPYCEELRKRHPKGLRLSTYKRIYDEIIDVLVSESDVIANDLPKSSHCVNDEASGNADQSGGGSELPLGIADQSSKRGGSELLSGNADQSGGGSELPLGIADQSSKRVGSEFPLPCESCGTMAPRKETSYLPCCQSQRTGLHCIVDNGKIDTLRCGRCGTDLLPASTGLSI